MLRKYALFVSVAMFSFAGCAYESKEILWICPGKKSVTESVSALKSDSQNIVQFKANGRCRYRYFDEDKSKSRSENLSVKLRVSPPVNIYLQGDAPLVSKAVVLGSNEDEFWLSIRPKEISAYWWGKWSEQDNAGGILINPKILLEALGIIKIDEEENWFLTNKGPFDILTKQDGDVITKKIYIYSCDYRIRKIEYFDPNGGVIARIKLAKYKNVSEDCTIPSSIEITTNAQGDTEESESITLNLRSIKPAVINDIIFNRRPPRGFKHVYQIANGKWIEESE
jgi:hypothetical protein